MYLSHNRINIYLYDKFSDFKRKNDYLDKTRDNTGRGSDAIQNASATELVATIVIGVG